MMYLYSYRKDFVLSEYIYFRVLRCVVKKLCVERNRMLPGPPIEILRYQKTSYLIRCLIIEYSLYKQREQDSVRSCSLHSQSDAVDRGFCASLQEVRGPSQWGHQLPLVLPGR